ncbi:MAG: glutamate-5-semialdehyde dehydrogenase, partial [Desulfitobacterium sp.]|nr:glutamate-5-semialdehyde dehydrogenase [Desulfitobacterium sp.]
MEFSTELLAMGQRARNAARKLAYISTAVKNQALLAMADALLAHEEEILEANKKDVEGAIARGTRKALVGRLTLTSEKIQEMSEALKEVVNLADPVGEGEFWTRPNGLRIQRTRVPLGVIAMIYEARPNVTVDAAALCLKSGNAVILRGGSEAIESNKVLSRVISQAAVNEGMPEGSIQLLENTDRQYAQQLMKMNGYVDAIIPRGGAGLIQTVVRESTVPVIETGAGL